MIPLMAARNALQIIGSRAASRWSRPRGTHILPDGHIIRALPLPPRVGRDHRRCAMNRRDTWNGAAMVDPIADLKAKSDWLKASQNAAEERERWLRLVELARKAAG